MPEYELHHGDCLEVMPKLAASSVHFVFADLPYGVTSNCEWDRKLPLIQFWEAIKTLILAQALLVASATMAFANSLCATAIIPFKYDLVWHKTRLTGIYNAKKMPLRAHENLLVFGPPTNTTYNPQMRCNSTGRTGQFRAGKQSVQAYGRVKKAADYVLGQPLNPHSVLQFPFPHAERGMHPTQKPVALLEWLIATYTNPGDTVLDPCFGSNTTGVACARLGRRYIGIEKDATYFAAGKARLEAEHARLAAQPTQASLAV